jgi:hypothetical protein
MAAFTALALGAGLGLGFLAGRRGKRNQTPEHSSASPAPVTAPSPAEQVAATKPVYAPAAESANTAAAKTVAARTRRRAVAGSAGLVGPKLGATQRGTYAGGTPRSLLGS